MINKEGKVNKVPDTPNTTALSDYLCYDHLIHVQLSDGTETILFPITRYDTLLGSPKVVTDMNTFNGAPFFFYQTDEVDVDRATLEQMIGISLVPD